MDKTKLIKNRSVLRTCFTKLHKNIEQSLDEENPDEIDIKTSYEILRERHEEIAALNEEIINIMIAENSSEEEIEAEYDTKDKYCKNLKKIELIIRKTFEKDDKESVAINNQIVTVNKRRFKLPQLELTKFNGELKEWLPFWNQFKQIHTDESVPAVEKFQYLRQCTVVGTRARTLVDSFPATEENYGKAIESLKARFGREDLLVEVYVRGLLKLVLKNVCRTSGKVSIVPLYDQLESHLRSLESLGITDDKFDAMLYPLVESSLPEDILRIWQRNISTVEDILIKQEIGEEQERTLGNCNPNTRLNKLMEFLKKEIENEERISLAKTSFGVEQTKRKIFEKEEVPTAIGLLNTKERVCVFCNKNHTSEDCRDAEKLSFEEKRNILTKKRCCFVCLKVGHISRRCRSNIVCKKCSKKHSTVMCYSKDKNDMKPSNSNSNPKEVIDAALTNLSSTHDIFLQTLKVMVRGENTQQTVRAIIDMGSQRSYILHEIATEMNYSTTGQEKLRHGLFGGLKSNLQTHNCYILKLSSLDGNYKCHFQVLDQPIICTTVNPIKDGPWIEELQDNQIHLTDVGVNNEAIKVLIGADVAGRLLTGKQYNLSNDISNFWKLDIIGIEDPVEKKYRRELDTITKQHFSETVCTMCRYEVHMPWVEGHPPLPTNYKIALNRLYKLLEKLKNDGWYDEYKDVLQEWLKEGIIEEVPIEETIESGHYLPHRHVVKINSATTKIRPVFDASAREPRSPSLNQCLEKGSNLIERIPNLLIKFRLNKIGVIADIRKAFLQISLCRKDRNYLRFLWSDDSGRRAVIEYHLKNCLEKCNAGKTNYSKESIKKLMKSMYVDNTVTSVDNTDELNVFIREAREIMTEAKFDLRCWEFNSDVDVFPNNNSAVLGLQWNRCMDVLYINPDCLDFGNQEKITKRVILSAAHKIFDPIGFTCPVSLFPKLLLRTIWKEKLKWDKEVSSEVRKTFTKWVEDVKYLRDVKIPRWFGGKVNENTSSIHVFTDASKFAYAAAIFLRIESNEGVKVQLLQARTRIAPTKEVSIPRLELLAATIGARLYADVATDNVMSKLPVHFWSDSSTVIAWIQRETIWGTFVRNRIEEISKLTSRNSWKHVPGYMNPADLPSRGCQAKQLLELQWWRGPSWLYKSYSEWPIKCADFDEEEVNNERKKTIVSALLNSSTDFDATNWFYKYFSKYQNVIRLIGWICRFKNNCLKRNKINGELTREEIEEAEKIVMILIQQQCFERRNDKNIKSLQPYKDSDGILRLKTKIVSREDDWEFLYPILLPEKHPVVDMLIRKEHKDLCHAGGQILLSKLRERFWIIRGRKAIRRVVSKCIVCRRYDCKPLNACPPPLPKDRVRDAHVFEITGIDLAGPLFIRGNQKVWICLYTCAVYRAIHLELLTSLSTECFLQSFRRFSARRGRPMKIYSDNGTNFVGANNLFKSLNWDEIIQYSSVRQIQWKFNPPTASWWGGWWERIIRIIKQLLKKVLSRAALTYEELATILCDCETIINSRPLTYISENPQDCMPLTPNMFIQDIQETGVPDCDLINHTSLNRRMQYRQKLIEALRQRFRNEYLGQLIQNSKTRQTNPIKIGEVVLIGNDNTKKLNWPLAKVKELFPGSDGQVRLVKLRSSAGEFLRPIQRIYSLEVMDKNEVFEEPESPQMILKDDRGNEIIDQVNKSTEKRTRRGRLVKPPQRLDLLSTALANEDF